MTINEVANATTSVIFTNKDQALKFFIFLTLLLSIILAIDHFKLNKK